MFWHVITTITLIGAAASIASIVGLLMFFTWAKLKYLEIFDPTI